MIMKKRYSRKDYEAILKVLLKVKTAYLAERAQDWKLKNPDKPHEAPSQITDDDLVPLKHFDEVLSAL